MQRMSAFQAAEAGNLEILQEWLSEEPGLINCVYTDTRTLLITAAEKGHLNIV